MFALDESFAPEQYIKTYLYGNAGVLLGASNMRPKALGPMYQMWFHCF